MPEKVEQKGQESLSFLPVLYTRDDSKLVQRNPLEEAEHLFKELTANDTSVAYQEAAKKTWNLFKQLLNLSIFLFLLLIALIVWVSGIAFQSGFNFWKWLEEEQPSLEKIITVLLKLIVWPFEQAFNWSAWFIKKYLGWENPLTQTSSSPKLEEAHTSPATALESSQAK